jgi:uncharacterized protein YaaQ
MKLIIAIVRDADNENISHALTASGFRVTTVASTGGFLRRGQTTMLIGLKDERLEEALELIRKNVTRTAEPGLKSATIFVIKVDEFVQF